MSKTVVHPETARRIEALRDNLPHALLLSGPVGVGLSSIAQDLVRGKEVLLVLPEKQEVVDIEKGTVTVDVIRRLYDQVRTKTSGRVVLIDYAERMAPQAQNAFLKLLEEPNDNVHFILLTHAPSTLLPTIHSRTHHIEVQPVSRKQSETVLDNLRVLDPTMRAQLLFIAEGLPAELIRLQDGDLFAQRSGVVRDARLYISGSTYDRLKLAQKYKDNRELALQLVEDGMKQLRLTLSAKKDPATLKSLDRLVRVYDRIAANGNIRLQLAAGV